MHMDATLWCGCESPSSSAARTYPPVGKLRAVCSPRSWVRTGLACAAAMLLVGCEGTVTLDLHTTAPADPAIGQVLVDLEGVELVRGGSTEALRFDTPVRVDLMQLENTPMRLFTDEQLRDGRYTGVWLLFEADDDEDDLVALFDGREFELTVTEGTASEVSFTVDEDDSTRESLALTLDLRQSLRFDEDARAFSLAPVVRAVRRESGGQIAGNVLASCPGGAALATGGGVYLFAGHDAVPDDRDNTAVEPYLTARVLVISGTVPSYNLPLVPEGDYTIALTCDGDEEDPAANDDLRFQDEANIRVRAEQTLIHDIGS